MALITNVYAEQTFSRSGVRVVTVCFGTTDTNLILPTFVGCVDKQFEEEIFLALDKLPHQNVDSAVQGFIAAYEKGASGSTWLVTSGRPAEDITGNVSKAYGILGQGVYD